MVVSFPEAGQLYLRFMRSGRVFDEEGKKLYEPAQVDSFMLVRRPDTLLVMVKEGSQIPVCTVIEYLGLVSHIGAMVAVFAAQQNWDGVPSLWREALSLTGKKYWRAEDMVATLAQADNEDVVQWAKLLAEGVLQFRRGSRVLRAQQQYQLINPNALWLTDAHATVSLDADLSDLRSWFDQASADLKDRGLAQAHHEACAKLLDLFGKRTNCTLMTALPESSGNLI